MNIAYVNNLKHSALHGRSDIKHIIMISSELDLIHLLAYQPSESLLAIIVTFKKHGVMCWLIPLQQTHRGWNQESGWHRRKWIRASTIFNYITNIKKSSDKQNDHILSSKMTLCSDSRHIVVWSKSTGVVHLLAYQSLHGSKQYACFAASRHHTCSSAVLKPSQKSIRNQPVKSTIRYNTQEV